MPRFCLPIRSVITLPLLALAYGCSLKGFPNAALAPNPLVSSKSSCSKQDPFNQAVNKALSAASLAQSAQSKEDWDLVVLRWIQAVEGMQAVPSSDPRQGFAQKKAFEYLEYMNVALAKAATATRSKLPFSTFNNESLDEQLRLYLSYVAAIGAPDVLIVGSSRALLGIDPRALQQALATKGRNLKVYNFGVNGATAQVVDLLVRQILSPNQLPQVILWADGVRAFNSGREDRTYNGIVASSGYKRLSTGSRPTLPQRKSEATDPCASAPDSSFGDGRIQRLGEGRGAGVQWGLGVPSGDRGDSGFPLWIGGKRGEVESIFSAAALLPLPQQLYAPPRDRTMRESTRPPHAASESMLSRIQFALSDCKDAGVPGCGEEKCRGAGVQGCRGAISTLSSAPLHPIAPNPHSVGAPSSPAFLLNGDWDSCCQPKATFVLAAVNASAFDIDSNGFLPVSVRFNPDTYYQKNPRIAGLYDADYQAFNFGGEQAAALNTLKAFTQSRNISLVFVNLPLTEDYLDSTRRKYEQQFKQFMQQQASQQGFVFLDLGTQWLTQYENFADPSHLNRFGAAAISFQLADELRIPWPRSRP